MSQEKQKKNPVGRPPKYKKEYCKQMLDYFKNAKLTDVQTEIVASGGKAVTIEKKVCGDMPTIGGFAISIDTHRATLYEWCRNYSEFRDAFKKCQEIQERWLTLNGLKGNVNTAFGIFTAKNVLGWRDKQEIQHSIDDIEFVDEGEE